MTYKISPIWSNSQFFNNNGYPLNGGKIFTYLAGSNSVKETTYSDNTGVPNSNPIQLDSNGRNAGIWIRDGVSYHFVLTAQDGTTVIDSADNIS